MATATETKPKHTVPPEAPPASAATGAATGTATGAAPAGGSAKAHHHNYFAYLFEPNKTPTKVLDALLRAIGQHVVSHFSSPPRPAARLFSLGLDLIAGATANIMALFPRSSRSMNLPTRTTVRSSPANSPPSTRL